MWVRLLQTWNDISSGQTIKLGDHTGKKLVIDGIAVEAEPPAGAVQPERENALLKTEREKRENV